MRDRQKQQEFRNKTFQDHREEFKSVFCRGCGLSMKEGEGYNSVTDNHGNTATPIKLEAHHLTPYYIAGHETQGILLCKECHTASHTDSRGKLSRFGQALLSVWKK